MRSTCCNYSHASSSSNHHHHHHHHHQPCHSAALPSSTSVPLFSAFSGMMSTSAGSAGGGGSGLMTGNNAGNCCTSSSYHHNAAFSLGTATLPASYSSNDHHHHHHPHSTSSTSHCSYYRSRTIGPNSSQQNCTSSCPACEHSSCTQSYASWLPFSRRAIALFALSLVFILIWSSVVAFVMLSERIKEQQKTRQTAELFELHRDVGQLAFEMGDEMIFTLNATMTAINQLDFPTANSTAAPANSSTKAPSDRLSNTINETITASTLNFDNSSNSLTTPTPTATHFSSGSHPLQAIHARWNKTDALLRQIGQSLATKGYLYFESDVSDQLAKLRSKCVHQVASGWPTLTVASLPVAADPLTRIAQTNQSASTRLTLARTTALWPLLADCVRTFEQSFTLLDGILVKDHFAPFGYSSSKSGEKQAYSKMTMTDLLIRNMPYTLFVRGIVHRFTSLSFGLILVRSNFTQSFNVSEYFHYYFSSRQLIESSFVWNYRFLAKYQELESTDYQADMLLTFFDSRRMQENDFYFKMSAIFSRVFSFETLKKIRSYIKKKNVESVERLMVVNGSGTKFVADQEANLMNIQLNTDLIELMGLENIEQVMYDHEQMLTYPTSANLPAKYDRLLRNQIGFLTRVQDFLNISLSGHLGASMLTHEQSLHYHTVLCTILLLSVFFTLTLFTCSGCCYRSPGKGCCSNSCCCCCCCSSPTAGSGKSAAAAATTATTLSRRFRRRLWNISSSYSPFSLFKLCFNGSPLFSSSSGSSSSAAGAAASSSSSSSATSPPRYPLLYKSSYQQHLQSPASHSRTFGHQRGVICSSHHHAHNHHHHHHHNLHSHHHLHPSSPSSSHQLGRRNVNTAINRSNVQPTNSRELSKAAAKLAEKSRSSRAVTSNTTAEAVSLIDRESRDSGKASTEPSCMCCTDNGGCSAQKPTSSATSSSPKSANPIGSSEASLPAATTATNAAAECSKCSLDGKCSSCQCKPLMSSIEEQPLPKNGKELKNNSFPSVVSSSSNGNNSKESTKKGIPKPTLLSKTP